MTRSKFKDVITIINKILTWLGQVLRTFDEWTGNYVLAMLIFAAIVELVLLPFAIKQQKNQIKQAKLRPKEMAIRNKYKGRNDAATQQKMQQEITEFYQKENFNPMGGCLPLLIQMPIILALYQIIINPLMYVVGFSKDQITEIIAVIGDKATGLNASQTIPVIEQIKSLGVEAFSGIAGFADKVPSIDALPDFSAFGANLGTIPKDSTLAWLLIPALVYAFQLLSTKLMRRFTYQAPSAQDANMGCSNSVMDYTMPLMSAYFAWVLPAAVGVYWIFKNIITFVKQVIISKLMPMPVFTDADYKAAEKELAAKSPKTSRPASSGKVVRSLHHIDDEDYDDTREAALARKKALEEAEAKEQAEREEKKKLSAALMKDEKNRTGGKKSKKSDKKTDEAPDEASERTSERTDKAENAEDTASENEAREENK